MEDKKETSKSAEGQQNSTPKHRHMKRTKRFYTEEPIINKDTKE